MIEVVLLGPDDAALLEAPPQDLFDASVRPGLARAFLEDPRHHMAAAVDGDRMVGFASAVHYVHPDKESELWINEVGVLESHRRRGLASRLMAALFQRGVDLGCREAWVLTERGNGPAVSLYRALGGAEPADETVMFSFSIGRSQQGAGPGGVDGR